MKTIKFILFAILFAITVCSCKKYPEGGNSIAAEQAVEGFWGIDNLTIDGIDSTAKIKAMAYYCDSIIYFSKTNNSKKSDFGTHFVSSYCSGTKINSGNWLISKDKKNLLMHFEYDSARLELSPIFLNQNITVTWRIMRLKDRKGQLWLKTNFNSKEYYLKLKKTGE